MRIPNKLMRAALHTLLICFVSIAVMAQATKPNTKEKVKKQPLFESEELLPITLSGAIKKLITNRGEDEPYQEINLSYSAPDSPIVIAMKAKIRGNFRRDPDNCNLPPIMLNFPKNDTVKNSVFKNQDKLKLVVTCMKGDYVEREYLVYKLFQLLSPIAFKVRLVKVQFDDEKLAKRDEAPFIGFLLENEELMANRTKYELAEKQNLQPTMTNIESYLTMVLFEYMIGNVDWSLQYEHNVKILKREGEKPWAVPYDFDHSGLVEAPYAYPPEELQMSSVRERKFRGICITDISVYNKVIQNFLKKKDAIYNLYANTTLVDEAYKKSTKKYLDDFYKTLGDEKELIKVLTYNCNSSDGNIIIKGFSNTDY